MPWKPGQTGNPLGQIKEKKFLAALERAIASDNGVKLRAAADKLVDCAAAGEGWAIKELADRLDGKPNQSVTTELNVNRDSRELTDNELRTRIATTDVLLRSLGRLGADTSSPESDSVH